MLSKAQVDFTEVNIKLNNHSSHTMLEDTHSIVRNQVPNLSAIITDSLY